MSPVAFTGLAPIFDVTVLGYVRTTRAALPWLRRSEGASIVNMSSCTAAIGLRRRVLYASTKGAIEAMTRAMQADLLHEGIRVNAVSPGTVDTDAFVASPPEVLPQVQAGKMKVLAVMADKRSAILPDVPTLREKGIDLAIGTWRAISAPASTPDEAVKVLHDGFAKGMQEKSFTDFMHGRGLTIRYMGSRELAEFVARERPIYEALAAEIKKTAKP